MIGTAPPIPGDTLTTPQGAFMVVNDYDAETQTLIVKLGNCEFPGIQLATWRQWQMLAAQNDQGAPKTRPIAH